MLCYVAGASPTPTPTALATQSGGLQLTNVSRKEHYPLYAPAGGGLNTSITLPYNNFGPASYVGSPAQLTIAGFDGTQWVNLSTTPTNSFTATTVTVTLPAGTDLSPYRALALASTSAVNPLPVGLTSFTATRQQTDGLLRWGTASELHADHFEVQTSADGRTWQTLGRVQAAGTSTAAHQYNLDHGVARYGAATVYYHLRQVDTDGTGQFSPVRSLASEAPAWALFTYPNPYAQDLSAQLTSAETGPITLTLFDAAGHTVLQQQVAAVLGSQVIALPGAAAMPAGAYVLRVQQNGHTGTVRVVRR